MAKFIYKRDSGEPLAWEFEPDKLMSPEAELIERLTGWTFKGWMDKVQEGSVLAIHALLFILLKRQDPQLQFDAVEFNLSQIDMDYDEEELTAAIDALQLKENRTAEEQESLERLQLQRLSADEPPKEAAAPTNAFSGNLPSPPT